MTIDIKVQRLEHGQNLQVPSYQSAGAAGMDLMCAIDENETLELQPGAALAVPTGLAIALPAGYEAQIRSRSGLAAKHSVTVLNAPGTIDSDYRGEIKVLLINHGQMVFKISRAMRIAQMVIAPVIQATLTEVQNLDETQRGAGGFGSTGVG